MGKKKSGKLSVKLTPAEWLIINAILSSVKTTDTVNYKILYHTMFKIGDVLTDAGYDAFPDSDIVPLTGNVELLDEEETFWLN